MSDDIKNCDIAVIGAGMGGLAAAALWAKRGYRVQLFDSHYSSGGCASYFKRREGFFDAGATTLSGLREGRPTQRLIKELGLELELHHCDPGIVVHLSEKKKFTFSSDLEKLAYEFDRVFGVDLRSELKLWHEIEEALWKSLSFVKYPTNMGMTDFLKLILQNNIKLITHPFLFTQSFYDFLPSKIRKNEELISFFDQILMISTQQGSRTCPAFMGILGLFYPLDTYALKGGMRHLCLTLEEKIQKYEGVISLRNPCLKIEDHNSHYLVETKKGTFRAERIISNIAPESLNALMGHETLSQKNDDVWGAMLAYFAVKLKSPVKGLYHQIHTEKGSLFFSFSLEGHESEGFQTVTVSTHIDKNKFQNERDEDYEKIKDSFKELVLTHFSQNFEYEELVFDSVGTPKTFFDYTSRPDGEVGGLVHHSLGSLLRLLPNEAKKGRLYCVGDYSFPGQGIVSVFQSALNTISDLK